MSIRKGMCLICAYTSYTYETLKELEYIYYNDLLEEVALKLQYMSVVNLFGRDYSDEGLPGFIEAYNPINIDHTDKTKKDNGVPKERVTLNKLKEVGLIK